MSVRASPRSRRCCGRTTSDWSSPSSTTTRQCQASPRTAWDGWTTTSSSCCRSIRRPGAVRTTSLSMTWSRPSRPTTTSTSFMPGNWAMSSIRRASQRRSCHLCHRMRPTFASWIRPRRSSRARWVPTTSSPGSPTRRSPAGCTVRRPSMPTPCTRTTGSAVSDQATCRSTGTSTTSCPSPATTAAHCPSSSRSWVRHGRCRGCTPLTTKLVGCSRSSVRSPSCADSRRSWASACGMRRVRGWWTARSSIRVAV